MYYLSFVYVISCAVRGQRLFFELRTIKQPKIIMRQIIMHHHASWGKMTQITIVTSWPRMTMTWLEVTERSKWCYGVLETQIIPIHWQFMSLSSTFWSGKLSFMKSLIALNINCLRLELWHHWWPEVNEVWFRSANLPGLSNAAWNWQISPVLSEIRGGAK